MTASELSPALIETVQNSAKNWHIELVNLLPITLGARLAISNKGFIMPHTGVGGKTISPDLLHLGFQPDFPGGIQQQAKNARPVYYHEGFHIAQKRHARARGEATDANPSAIEAAILEGGGSRFESLRAGSTPPWAEYSDEATMVRLTEQMAGLPQDYDISKWLHYDPETGALWTGYKVGTFVTDKAMQEANISIEEIASIAPKEILDLSGVL